MVSRRRFLHLGVGAVLAATGCVGDSAPKRRRDRTDRADETSASPSPADASDAATETPDRLPAWSPDWSLSFGGRNVLGLDAAADGETLFATVSTQDGPSSVVAVDPASQSSRWRTEMAGEAVAHSHASFQRISRGQWGVTLASDAVYAVAGMAEEREWTALHALDRQSGDARWSVRRDRALAVAGVSDGLVVAAGLEFFPPPDVTPTSHQTPEEPLTTVVYALDAADGSVRWEREFTAVADVAVGDRGAFVATDEGVTALGRDGGERFSLDVGPATWVEVAGERLFVLTGDDDRRTLRGVAPDGTVEWRRELPVHELLLHDDRLYAGGDAVVAVESDGRVVWRDDDYGQWLLVDPDGDTLYTRSQVGADAATAYAVDGDERWTFDPPSNDAWPETATTDSLVVSAITGDHASDPFLTVYAVDSAGEATASFGVDTVFDAVGVGDTAYLADGDSTLRAFTPP
ncbi:PQQ-binding-like beta-propeller repeat protein [Halogeometricum limi]|uniref:PQQ-like domain-containing protein n=1 Tax=Halogeometricum limi TaxID=555875 RepID=A0A1I6IR36_9EURY|nr:PQQ-binding-like beta-propeller repeat protein [Halogeometricum limi]SFR69079.1 PQQ-like domain-containing protein [Halogeometricum limi]